MKNWKLNQEVYHRTAPPSDFIESKGFVVINDAYFIIHGALSYFREPSTQLVYPAKSYAVAIVYAALIAKYFDEDFLTVLNDPDLLYGNDMFFVPYIQEPKKYDSIVRQLIAEDLFDFEASTIPQVQVTVDCFKREFLIS